MLKFNRLLQSPNLAYSSAHDALGVHSPGTTRYVSVRDEPANPTSRDVLAPQGLVSRMHLTSFLIDAQAYGGRLPQSGRLVTGKF